MRFPAACMHTSIGSDRMALTQSADTPSLRLRYSRYAEMAITGISDAVNDHGLLATIQSAKVRSLLIYDCL